jgi:hypothetical protein
VSLCVVSGNATETHSICGFFKCFEQTILDLSAPTVRN